MLPTSLPPMPAMPPVNLPALPAMPAMMPAMPPGTPTKIREFGRSLSSGFTGAVE
jgi:hypothetical protein